MKLAVAAPLDDHGLAALLANLVGRLLHALDVGHVALGVFQVFLETLVELAHGHAPVELAFFDIVQLAFHASRIGDVEQVVEAFEQKIGNHHAELGRRELAAVLADVFALLDGG